jgi:hypothetical protein
VSYPHFSFSSPVVYPGSFWVVKLWLTIADAPHTRGNRWLRLLPRLGSSSPHLLSSYSAYPLVEELSSTCPCLGSWVRPLLFLRAQLDVPPYSEWEFEILTMEVMLHQHCTLFACLTFAVGYMHRFLKTMPPMRDPLWIWRAVPFRPRGWPI